MISNMLKIVLGAVLASGLLLASNTRSLGDKKSIVQDKVDRAGPVVNGQDQHHGRRRLRPDERRSRDGSARALTR